MSEPGSKPARLRNSRLRLNGIGGATGGQIVVLVAGIASGITLARSLGPAGRGELAAALLWPGIIVLFADMGLGYSLSYHAGRRRESLNQLWTMAVLFGGLGGAALACAGWLTIPRFVPVLLGPASSAFHISLLSVPCVLVSGYQAYLLLGLGYVADFTAVRVFTAIANTIFVLTFALAKWDSISHFALTNLLSQISGLAVSSVLVAYRVRPRLCWRFPLLREIFGFGLKSQFASLASQYNIRADQAAMSISLSVQELGNYVIAVALSAVLNPFLTAIALVLFPRTTHAASSSEGAFLIARHVKFACLAAIPVIAVSVLGMPLLVRLFYGDSFALAVPAAQVLVVAGLSQGINTILGNGLRGLGKPGSAALAEGAGLVLTGILLLLLLRPLGIIGAAVTSFIAYTAVALVQFFFVAQGSGATAAQLLRFSPDEIRLLTHPWTLLRSRPS